MQERVLGAMIIGGIALVGVVWALIDGVPPLVKAKKQERNLETKLVERIQKIDPSVTSIDIKRASFITKEVKKPNRLDPNYTVPVAVIRLEGKNDKGELCQCVLNANNNYILDLQHRIGSYTSSADLPIFCRLPSGKPRWGIRCPSGTDAWICPASLRILNDSTTEFVGYYKSESLYTALSGESGTKIVGVGDPNVRTGKQNNPYSVHDIVTHSDVSSLGQVYITGKVSEITIDKNSRTANFWLEDGTNKKAIQGETVSIGTGIKNIEVGEYVLIQSSVVSDNGIKIKEVKDGSITIGSKIEEKSSEEYLSLGENSLTTKAADEKAKDLKYGEMNDELVNVTGEIASISVSYDQTAKDFVMTLRLKSEGKDANHYLEVKQATFDRTYVDAIKPTSKDDVETIAGLVVKLLGRLAKKNDIVVYENLEFIVKDVYNKYAIGYIDYMLFEYVRCV